MLEKKSNEKAVTFKEISNNIVNETSVCLKDLEFIPEIFRLKMYEPCSRKQVGGPPWVILIHPPYWQWWNLHLQCSQHC